MRSQTFSCYVGFRLAESAGRLSNHHSLAIKGKRLHPVSRLRRTIGGKVNMLLGDAGSMHAQELVYLVAKERK
jgi:hypothetical protein